jgi:hypothetical protein
MSGLNRTPGKRVQGKLDAGSNPALSAKVNGGVAK